MSLSPSKETVWSKHQESLKHIREKLNGGRRVKSGSPSHPASRQSRLRYGNVSNNDQRRTTSNTPSFLPRLATPPEHDRLRSNNNLRGNKYNIVPPVQPKEAFINSAEHDSWGEESESEDDSGSTPGVLPFAVPVYPTQPAVVYPGVPGQPYVFYPPVMERRKTKIRHKERNHPRKPGQKKSVTFDTNKYAVKPIDTERMKKTQLHPVYGSLYTSMSSVQPSGPGSSQHVPTNDPFDENRNPILQKYKYIYPSRSVTQKSEPRSVLTSLDRNSHRLVLDPSYHEVTEEVCHQLVSSEVEGLVRELIRETTNELVDNYLDVKLISHDPLEDFLTQLMNDGVEAALKLVVKETLRELTEDALIFSGSSDIVDDLICTEINEAVPDMLNEVTLELMMEDFLDEEVIRSEVAEEGKVVAKEVLVEVDDKIRRKEFKEVSKYAQEKLSDSVCLDYLLALVSRQGTIWSQSDYANRAMDSMMLSLLVEQYFSIHKERAKTLDNVALRQLHEKAVTGVALDVFLGQLAATLDEDMADVDEYEWGISLPVPTHQPLKDQ